MNTEKLVWIVNDWPEDFERIDIDLKKKIVLRAKRPIQLPISIAMKYQKFNTIKIITDPEKYFSEENKMKRLVIRDAGIGDLLLLEPILRTLKSNSIELSILSRFPDVFKNNPYIDFNIKMESRDDINVKLENYDYYDDLRHYSETCINRDKKNRTDCYNQIFNFDIPDKEPRLYFNKNEISFIKKEENKVYIGIAPDGSHCYRRLSEDHTIEIIKYLLQQNSDYNIVLFGNRKLVKNFSHERLIDIQGRTTTREAINIIRELDYMISVDSGLLHVSLSMHIPTVCIFSIIQPNLRVQYYTGQKESIVKTDCNGCGSWHMSKCKFGDTDKNINFIAPCLDVSGKEIFDLINKMHIETNKRIFYNNNDNKIIIPDNTEVKKVNVKTISDKKLIMPIIVLNEEKNLPRFIELVMSNKNIGKVIAIDGGSTDKTVELLTKAGAYVYTHIYDTNYHDAQALQRNISCSFIRDGEKIIIMDIDECFSKELADYLPELCESDIIFGRISRRTFKYFADINDPQKQIKHYPDYQPRFFTWNKKFKWVCSPHHIILNVPDGIKIDKDIIHFECENKNRDELEKRWAETQKKTKEIYG